MIRYLECHDLHVSPENIDITEDILSRIEHASIEHQVDFIVTSDLHDKNFYLCKEYNRFRAAIKRILAACPIVAVTGTPGHETEAMYGPLQDLGLVLLRPGRMYVLDSAGKIYEQQKDCVFLRDNRAILFGVPELTKQSIQADLSLPATEANAKAEEIFARYVREYIAPMRAHYPDIPAIGVLHSTVTDYSRENEIDVKRKSASIIIRTADLEPADLTRWSLGHIHMPFESSKICAGYAGSWGTNWNETGFIPAMNLVEISDAPFLTRVTRIPYCTPRREKITEPLPVYSPDIAYWLDSADPDAPCPAGHPWSRVTHTPQRTESRRITQEQAQDARLSNLFKLFDPSVDDTTLELVDGLEHTSTHTQKEPLDISIDSVKIDGCIFWGSRSISFEPARLSAGLTQIDGSNGEGKSSLVAFCTPYPVIVGKDTKSGRASAIKDFFDMPDSRIEKNLTVNGVPHHHLITIRGAHTHTPKVECYLEINGVPQLERSTFDEMFDKCEQLYGSYVDYLLTTFYVQPLQGKTGSSLMSATMTDIRDLVQTIAGIDREEQKKQALDTASAIEKQLAEKEAWIKGAETNAVDVTTISTELKQLMIKESVAQTGLTSITEHGTEVLAEHKRLLEKQKVNDAEKLRKGSDDKAYKTAMDETDTLVKKIEALEALSQSLESNRLLLVEDDERMARMTARQEIITENGRRQNEYNKLKNEYDKRLAEAQLSIKIKNNEASNKYKVDLDYYTSKKAEYESTIATFAHPCEHCGEIPYADVEKKIAHARAELAKLVEPIKSEPLIIPETVDNDPHMPIISVVPELEDHTIDRDIVKARIEAGVSAEATIKAHETALAKLHEQIKQLSLEEYTIDETLDERVTTQGLELECLRAERDKLKTDLAVLATQIAEHQKQIAEAKAKTAKIESACSSVVSLSDLLGRWKYIASQLRPEKIPAMELDLMLDLIDLEATRNLSPYHDGAYTFQTRTQRVGKKDVVDAFDIVVHDARTGREKSFLAFSPGQKAFLNDAYVKALIRIRNQRAHITYSPIVSDEADSPVEIAMIPTFYAMQERYYLQEKVLVISHTPDARNYIGNRIQIKELIG